MKQTLKRYANIFFIAFSIDEYFLFWKCPLKSSKTSSNQASVVVTTIWKDSGLVPLKAQERFLFICYTHPASYERKQSPSTWKVDTKLNWNYLKFSTSAWMSVCTYAVKHPIAYLKKWTPCTWNIWRQIKLDGIGKLESKQWKH